MPRIPQSEDGPVIRLPRDRMANTMDAIATRVAAHEQTLRKVHGERRTHY